MITSMLHRRLLNGHDVMDATEIHCALLANCLMVATRLCLASVSVPYFPLHICIMRALVPTPSALVVLFGHWSTLVEVDFYCAIAIGQV